MVYCITSVLFCNPFNEHGHDISNKLKNLLPWMAETLPQLNSDHKVCDKRHNKISKISDKQRDGDSDKTEQFAMITASLQSIGESPTKMKRLGKGKYPTRRMNIAKNSVETKFLTFLKMSLKVQFLDCLVLKYKNS
jgi:hypothetical protein